MQLGQQFETAYLRSRRLAERRTPWLAALALGACAIASPALAAPCQRNSDCPADFTCETIGQTACSTPSSCDGGTCPPCEPVDVKVCVSPTCRRDSDCPNGMDCYRGQQGQTCIPRYLVDCVRDDDCGDGFSCVEQISTHCPGSAGQGGSGSCTTRRTGIYRCQLQERSCSSATDCPSLFSCGPNPAAATCSNDEDAGAACQNSGSVCLPPYAAVDFALPDVAQPTGFDRSQSSWSSSSQGSYYYPNGHNHHNNCAVADVGAAAGSARTAWLALLGLGAALAFRRRRRR